MPRASVKENKNDYQLARESRGLTREEAEGLTDTVSAARIAKIESGSLPRPEEILELASAYKKSGLCNYYCTHECAIGKRYVPETDEKSIYQIVLELLAALNSLEQKKDRLIEICSDGVIHDDQIADFVFIGKKLRQIVSSSDALRFWMDDAVACGGINLDILKRYTDND